MNRYFVISVGALAIGLPLPTSAQVKPQLSVDGVICKLAGTCDQLESVSEAAREDQGRLVGNERAFTFSVANNAQSEPETEEQNGQAGTNVIDRRQSQSSVLRPDTGLTRSDERRYSSVGQSTRSRSADMLVTFRLGSAEMTAQALENARVVARALQSQQLGDSKFLVEGHTDASGTRAYNLDLSRRRALAVMEFLVDEGVSPERLKAAGFGFDRLRIPSRPTDPTNRRVQIVKID